MSPSQIVRELTEDLTPVHPPPRLVAELGVWLALSWSLVLLGLAAVGPFRPGFAADLASSPRFLAEVLLGIAASTAAALAALRLSVPGLAMRGALWTAGGLIVVWLGLHTYALQNPSLPPSMVGKRPLCFYETLVFALPPFALAVRSIRKRYALHRLRAAALSGLAGAAIPAVVMQIACMSEPWHVISHHLLPVSILFATSGMLGAWVFRRP